MSERRILLRINTEQLRILMLQVMKAYPNGVNADYLLAAVYHAAVADFIDLPDVMEHLAHENLITFSASAALPKCCILSDLGKSVLAELGAAVPEEAVRAVKREYDSLTQGIEYTCSVQTDSNGTHLCCKATQNGIVLTQIDLLLEDEKTAYAAKQNFDKRPEEILRALKAVLNGKADFLLES